MHFKEKNEKLFDPNIKVKIMNGFMLKKKNKQCLAYMLYFEL